MSETIDQTIRQRLRKWLGIQAHEAWCLDHYKEVIERLGHEETMRLELEVSFDQKVQEIENTRQDLLQRMQDLSEELAQRKSSTEKPAEDQVLITPARKTFSQRRREAQGSERNMSAYLTPKKPTT